MLSLGWSLIGFLEIWFLEIFVFHSYESSNGHKHSSSDETPVLVPKRKRSSSGQSAFRSPSSTTKVSSIDTGGDSLKVRVYSFQYIDVEPETPDSKHKIFMQRKLARSNKLGMLTPLFQKNVSSSKRKGKGLDWSNDETNEVGEASDREVGYLSTISFFML